MASLFLNPMYIVTFIGEPELWAALSVALILIYFLVSRRWPGRFLFFKRFLAVLIPTLVVVLLIVLLLKLSFPVARPCMPCTMVQEASLCNPYCPAGDPSFPSAHAGVAFGVFTALWLVKRKLWRLPVLILPALVAYSRVALGVHTWLDVLVGSLIGIAVAAVVHREIEKRFFSYSEPKKFFKAKNCP